MASRDTNTGAKRARQLRDELSLAAVEPLDCILTLVESLVGLPVVVAALPEAVSGCCWRDGDRVVLWVNGTHAPVRQRFTLAHELGHIRCGHDGATPVETFVTLGGLTTDSREVQANAFAAELLAPAPAIRARVGDGQPELAAIVRIAAEFGISTIAALYRVNSLGLTARYEALAEAVANGEHEQVWKQLEPPAFADRIAAIDRACLPRLSPALEGSVLDALVRGRVTAKSAAAASGCDPAALADAAASVGI